MNAGIQSHCTALFWGAASEWCPWGAQPGSPVGNKLTSRVKRIMTTDMCWDNILSTWLWLKKDLGNWKVTSKKSSRRQKGKVKRTKPQVGSQWHGGQELEQWPLCESDTLSQLWEGTSFDSQFQREVSVHGVRLSCFWSVVRKNAVTEAHGRKGCYVMAAESRDKG